MPSFVGISRDAYFSDYRYLAMTDALAMVGQDHDEVLVSRRSFWAALLQPDAGVKHSEQKGNSKIRIARLNGGASVLGYLAIDLPASDSPGFVRPGLHVVISPRLPESVIADEKLRALGDVLVPEITEVIAAEPIEALYIPPPAPLQAASTMANA